MIEQRGGRHLVFLRSGDTSARLGGFATRAQADQYAATIAAASPEVVDAAAERALTVAIFESNVAAQNVRKWTEERNRAIVAALDAGATQRAVAEAVGLTHTAVAKIAKRAP